MALPRAADDRVDCARLRAPQGDRDLDGAECPLALCAQSGADQLIHQIQ